MMEDNVPGFIGYHITRDGKLYSRRIESSPYKFGKWHKLRLSKKARVKVKLYNDGRGYNLSISRLVALVYVYNPNPSKFNEVMHLDNNPLNNHYKNLYWGTQSINMKQAYNDGRIGKLNSDQVLEILSSNLKEEELAKKYNVSIKVIHRCLKRKKKNR